jgi:hypothetical protein
MWSRLSLSAAISVAFAIAAVLPAAASTTDTNGQITLTANGSTTMTYGESSPTFRSVLTLASGDPSPTDMTFYFLVDSQMYIGSVSWSNPNWTLFENGFGPPPLSVGQHSVVAQYKSTNHVLTSAPVILNVLKKTPGLDCSINNVTNTYATNTPLTITVGFSNTNAPVDIQNGTFSITFTGPRTFTTGNLRPNSAGQVFASAPPATGVYQTKCAFSGTGSFNPAETHLNIPTIIVSANNHVGAIALYTNPTPVTHGPMITWEVIVSPKSGLPTPTGYVGVDIGVAYTKLMALGPDGSLTFQAIAPGLGPSDTIRVDYMGDPVYAWSNANFPLTTPPIPGAPPSDAGPAAQGPPTASTGTPAATESASPAATENPTPRALSMALPSPSNRVGAALLSASGQSAPDGRRGLLLVGAIALLTLVGVGAGLTWRQRQRRQG